MTLPLEGGGIYWDDPRVPEEMRKLFMARNPSFYYSAHGPACTGFPSGARPCPMKNATFWHPEVVGMAYCVYCVPGHLVLIYTRLWDETFGPIEAAVAYEIRAEARKAESARTGKIVFAAPPPIPRRR